jgi:hypothetical protein
LLLEGLNLELNEIIDLPPESKKQLLSHREHALQSSSLVTQLGRDLYCGSRPPAKQPDSQTRVAKLWCTIANTREAVQRGASQSLVSTFNHS